MLKILKSKIREAQIKKCDTECEGSITIPKEIMEKANILPYEYVEVNSKHETGRITTYVIPGEQFELNGGAANHFKKGDIVHINCFEYFDKHDLFDYYSGEFEYKPIIV